MKRVQSTVAFLMVFLANPTVASDEVISTEIDEYMAQIQKKIDRRIHRSPCELRAGSQISVEFILLPDGSVLSEPKIITSSGDGGCDMAVKRAVLLAQPLPVPADPVLFRQFRELSLKFRPNDRSLTRE